MTTITVPHPAHDELVMRLQHARQQWWGQPQPQRDAWLADGGSQREWCHQFVNTPNLPGRCRGLLAADWDAAWEEAAG